MEEEMRFSENLKGGGLFQNLLKSLMYRIYTVFTKHIEVHTQTHSQTIKHTVITFDDTYEYPLWHFYCHSLSFYFQ